MRVRVLKNREKRRATALGVMLAVLAVAVLGRGAAPADDHRVGEAGLRPSEPVAGGTAPSQGPDHFVLIRNAHNPVTKLTRAEIKDMAVGKKKVWPQGPVVQMVLAPAGSPELGWFTSAVVGAPEATFLAKVRQEVFKGEMRRPIMAAADKDCLDAVASDPGALGVISTSTASNLPPGVGLVGLR